MRTVKGLLLAPLGSVPVAAAYVLAEAAGGHPPSNQPLITVVLGTCAYGLALASIMAWTCWPLAVLLRRLGADGPAAFAILGALLGLAPVLVLTRPWLWLAQLSLPRLAGFVATAAIAGAVCALIYRRVTSMRQSPVPPASR